MAKIAIVNTKLNKGEMRQCSAVPRIGEQVDLWYRPSPTVTQVVWFPDQQMRSAFKLDDNVDVVIVAE